MSKNILLSFLVLWTSSMIAAVNIVPGVGVDRNGAIKFDNIAMRLSHYDKKWCLAVQNGSSIKPAEGYPATNDGNFKLQAKWNLRDGKFFDLTETVKKFNESSFNYFLKLDSAAGNPTNTLCLSLILPCSTYAGKTLYLGNEKFTLPSQAEKKYLLSRSKVKKLVLTGGKKNLSIEGSNLKLFLQDNRKYGRKSFELRILTTPSKGTITSTGLNLKFTVGATTPKIVNTSKNKQQTDGGIKVDNKGIVYFGNISMSLKHFDKKWSYSIQKGNGFRVSSRNVDNGNTSIKAKWNLSASDSFFDVTENVRKAGPAKWEYSAVLESASGVPTNILCVSIDIPADVCAGKTIQVDGTEVKLPQKYEKMTIFRKYGVKDLVLNLGSPGLQLKGNMNLVLQDNRKFKSEVLELRIMCSPENGNITSSKVAFNIEQMVFRSEPVSIRKQANMAFRDEVADDKKGGWTDQGPENDLRMLKSGRQDIGGVTFDIVDPASNNGKGCMVFTCDKRDYFLGSAEIKPAAGMNKYIYLLHSIAWAPKGKTEIGKLEVKYTDGDSSSISVMNKRDVGNWWGPASLSNGILAWTGENRQSYVGLFLSKFPLKGKAIKTIRFVPIRNAVWMVAGVSMSNANIPINNTQPPCYIVAGYNWKKVADPNMDIVPGSALDFSGMLDAPAGKHGRVVIRNGHFEFEKVKGQKVRFYGNNLCFTAQYLDKESCKKLAKQFAAIGYNSVRFHHYDNNLIDKKAKSSTIPDKELLDKLDYLFYCFKMKGIYITTDLFCSRRFKAGEVEGFGNLTHYEMKALAPINQAAFDNWKEFSRNFLTHKNPYTGMSWGDDPALFAISVVNEDTIYDVWKNYPQIKKAYLKLFDQYLKDKNIVCSNETERWQHLSKFLIDLQIKNYLKMKAYLKDDLKIKANLSDANFLTPVLLSFLREKLDYVDNHAYWDHPSFVKQRWRLPYRYKNISAIKRFAQVPRDIMPGRILGKPYMVTEFNYCFPNEYRSEGGVLMGAYAALQDWDGLYRFAYSHSRKGITSKTQIDGFNLVSDPLNMLSEKLGILFFLRGDVKTASKVYPFVFDDKSFKKVKDMNSLNGGKFPEKYSRLGLYAGIGAVNGKQAVNNNNIYNDGIAVPEVRDNSVKSSTGELFINRDKVEFSAVTPRSEVFVKSGPGKMTGKSLSMTSNGGFCVVGASAMDGNRLSNSKKLLLFHLTDVQNNKIKFMTDKKKILLNWGSLPLLMRRGDATVTLKHQKIGKVRAWALSFNGRRMSEVPVTSTADGITIKCSTVKFATMIYEIIFE